jgi:hypothetical protein
MQSALDSITIMFMFYGCSLLMKQLFPSGSFFPGTYFIYFLYAATTHEASKESLRAVGSLGDFPTSLSNQ